MMGWLTIGTKLETKKFDAEINALERKLEDMEADMSISGEDLGISEYNELASQIEKTKNKIISLRTQQNKMATEDLANVGKSMGDVVKKVSKWALAIFGVRSAYSAVRSSISIISQYDKQLATDIDYIKFALANTLKPIIEWLIGAVYKILGVINAIAQAMFNVNLFSNGSANAFKKANAQAKSLSKTLSGFDEMNILQDTSAGGGGDMAPSIDLGSGMESEIEKIKSFWGDITSFWEQGIYDFEANLKGHWATFIKGWLDALQGVYYIFKGVFDTISGVVQWFMALFSGDLDAMGEAWNKVIKGLAEIFLGFVEIIGGALEVVFGFFGGLFGDIWDGLVLMGTNIINKAGEIWGGIKNVFSNVASFFKTIFTNAWTAVKNVFSTGGKIFVGITDGIINGFKTIVNAIIDGINNVVGAPFKAINGMLNKIHDVNILGVKPFAGLWKRDPIGVPKIPRLAKGGIVNMPGRGVMVGGAIAGEAGREAVLPLQDNQVLNEIADAIGRRITINANITNTMNGRVISRELQKVQNNSDFAFNR